MKHEYLLAHEDGSWKTLIHNVPKGLEPESYGKLQLWSKPEHQKIAYWFYVGPIKK